MKKENKIFTEKQISKNIIIGKVRANGRTRWRMRIADFAAKRVQEVSYRKSKFKTIEQFEKFLRIKFNLG